jgi:uncharacterized protein (DUF342 family)
MELFSFTPLIDFNSETDTVTATLEPSFGGPTLTRKDIDDLLETQGYQNYFMLEDGIDELLITDQTLRSQGQKVFEVFLKKLEKSNQADKPEEDLTNNYNPQQIFSMLGRELPSLPIAEKRNGTIEISASDHDLKALLTLQKPFGGEPITLKDIEKEIQSFGIAASVNETVIQQVLETGECTNLTFAVGVKPQKGKDSRFEKLVNDRFSSAPKIDENGIANYRDINEFVVVEAGTPLMRRHAPANGKNGTDIFGKMIPSHAGDALPFSANIEGSTISKDDPDLLVATIKGHPILDSRGVSIDNVLVIKNVSLASGNIDFDGSVCVEEDVADGASIKAAGDVTIKGAVGKSNIEAEGNVLIAQGFIGGANSGDKTQDNESFEAIIKAKGKVSAKFASGAKIISGDEINIAEYASHCDMQATHKIQLGQPHGKGSLIGGNSQAFKLVSAKILGSTGGTPTNITVGADADTIINLRRITQSLHKKKIQISEIYDELRKLSIRAKVAGVNPQTKEMMEKYNDQQKQIDLEILELNQQEKEVKHLLMRSKKARITGAYKVWQNVSVSILGASHTVKDEMSASSFFFESRGVQVKH